VAVRCRHRYNSGIPLHVQRGGGRRVIINVPAAAARRAVLRFGCPPAVVSVAENPVAIRIFFRVAVAILRRERGTALALNRLRGHGIPQVFVSHFPPHVSVFPFSATPAGSPPNRTARRNWPGFHGSADPTATY